MGKKCSRSDVEEFDFSEYSLVADVARQSGQSSGGKYAKHAVESDVTGRHCLELAARGQIRCWLHKLALTCISSNMEQSGGEEEQNLLDEVFGKSTGDLGTSRRPTW